ncbi:MAG TPA: putative glycoside hydrolase [Gemmatimonadaceae bacterium]|nr:putative glycoside hydrolase [Gemmatimonadaceae bacterium]
MIGRATLIGVAALLVACTGSDRAHPDGAPTPEGTATPRPDSVVNRPDTVVVPDSIRRPATPLVATPNPVRGLYVNRWAAIGERMWQLIDVAKQTEVNALVIDVKDDRGFVLYHSQVPLAKEIGADTTRPMSWRRLRAVLDTMRAHNIYPIARIVVAKDPLLAEAKPEWSIKRKRDSLPWLDKNQRPWLDPTHPEVWKYAGDLAAEAVDLGFSEVQFDYVRFPDEDRLIREALFPLMNGRVRAQVIHDQLSYLRSLIKPLRVPMTIDVFGLSATDTTDMGIGQKWELFVDQVDVVLPMDYPSHFAPGTFGLGNPNAHPYATLDHALRDAKRRSASIPNAARITPWYQDFTLGPPRYGATQVKAQMRAGHDNGIDSWMLWNPGSRYSIEALGAEAPVNDTTAQLKRPRD